MEIIHTRNQLTERVLELKSQGKRIGFVPTMGALHQGHISLVEKACSENEIVGSSIFVNPLQFNNPQDLEKYPRTLDHDLPMLEAAGCHIVFTPTPLEMYPEPVKKQYDFGELEHVMEGRYRPGHFNGVGIVVERLFDIFQPDKAYFGEKDYQQLLIVKSLVKQCGMSVEIIPCPIIRESDGLAMSSRNRRLSVDQRQHAPLIYQVMKQVRERRGDIPINTAKEQAFKTLQDSPWFDPEYVEICNQKTLQPTDSWEEPEGLRIFVAAQMGSVRLIDNMSLSS